MTHHNSPARQSKRYLSLSVIILFCLMAALSWASSETVHYTYDNTYQIKKAAFTNFTTSYAYDDAGNINSITTNPQDTTAPHLPC